MPTNVIFTPPFQNSVKRHRMFSSPSPLKAKPSSMKGHIICCFAIFSHQKTFLDSLSIVCLKQWLLVTSYFMMNTFKHTAKGDQCTVNSIYIYLPHSLPVTFCVCFTTNLSIIISTTLHFKKCFEENYILQKTPNNSAYLSLVRPQYFQEINLYVSCKP